MKYPYYIVPAVEEYRKLNPDSEEAKKLSRLIAANVGDLASLRLIIGIDPPEFAKFYPDMENVTPTTMDTIDSFLDKFGKNLPDDPLVKGAGEYRIEEEIMAEDEEPQEEKENFRKLIKEKKYEEALQFIEHQNLNNPQKSIYFALQIRFIKKLMAIEKYRKLTKG